MKRETSGTNADQWTKLLSIGAGLKLKN